MTTNEIVDQATVGLDDNLLKPDDGQKPEVVEDKKPEPAKPDETPEDGKPVEDDKTGYSADELVPEEDPAKPKEAPKPAEEIRPVDTDSLSPEAKFIVDNLPFITARIKDGDGVKEVQVKSWTQLPDDLEFATKRDEMAFINAIGAQENRALKLQGEFQTKEQQKQNSDFEVRENNAVREDIAKLQKDGDLPKFKAKVDDPDFSKDPATEEVQGILDYMHERNQQYLKEYEQGRPYRHIGFEEAFHMKARLKPKETPQAKEDKERRDVADKVGGNKGLTAREMKKPTVRPGTRVEQILERIDREW